MVTFIVNYYSTTSNLLVNTQIIPLPLEQLMNKSYNEILEVVEDKVLYTSLDRTISVKEGSNFTFTSYLKRVNGFKDNTDIFG